jgi:hypothetical protein
VQDELFDYVLPNKAMAAARSATWIAVHETIVPPGAVIWAAVGKSPGGNPQEFELSARRLASAVGNGAGRSP